MLVHVFIFKCKWVCVGVMSLFMPTVYLTASMRGITFDDTRLCMCVRAAVMLAALVVVGVIPFGRQSKRI